MGHGGAAAEERRAAQEASGAAPASPSSSSLPSNALPPQPRREPGIAWYTKDGDPVWDLNEVGAHALVGADPAGFAPLGSGVAKRLPLPCFGFSQGCFGLVSQGCFGLAFFPDHGGGPNRP